MLLFRVTYQNRGIVNSISLFIKFSLKLQDLFLLEKETTIEKAQGNLSHSNYKLYQKGMRGLLVAKRW